MPGRPHRRHLRRARQPDGASRPCSPTSTRRGITRVVNLGDVVGKGPRGSEAIALHPGAVRGDGARQLGHLHRPRRSAAWPARAVDARPPERRRPELDWLAGLPTRTTSSSAGSTSGSSTPRRSRVPPRALPPHGRAVPGDRRQTEFTGDGPAPTIVGYGDIHGAYLRGRLRHDRLQRRLARQPARRPGAPRTSSSRARSATGAGSRGGPAAASEHHLRARALRRRGRDRIARSSACPTSEPYALELRDQLYRGSALPPQS